MYIYYSFTWSVHRVLCVSFCGLLKGVLVRTSHPSVLLPVLRLVEQASPAFPPLQSAAGGLLSMIELIKVRHRSLFDPNTMISLFSRMGGPESDTDQR